MDLVLTRDVEALGTLKRLSAAASATAGGSGNSATTTGVTIDRGGWSSGMPMSVDAIVAYEAGLQSGKTLSFGYSIKDLPDGSNFSDLSDGDLCRGGDGRFGRLLARRRGQDLGLADLGAPLRAAQLRDQSQRDRDRPAAACAVGFFAGFARNPARTRNARLTELVLSPGCCAPPGLSIEARAARLRARSLMIATPIARNPVWQYTASFGATIMALMGAGFRSLSNSWSAIRTSRARNELVAKFLASPATDLLFVDDDMDGAPRRSSPARLRQAADRRGRPDALRGADRIRPSGAAAGFPRPTARSNRTKPARSRFPASAPP